jgi:cytochrome c biogenesis protein CcdA
LAEKSLIKYFKDLERKRIRNKIRREIKSNSNNVKGSQRKIFFTIISLFLALIITASIFYYFTFDDTTPQKADKTQTYIFYNEACSGCVIYIDEELIPAIKELGFKDIIKKDYINQRSHRVEMNDFMDENDIPFSLQSHIMTFIYSNITIILGGHVPTPIIDDLIELDNISVLDKIIIFQDKMDNPTSYFVWGFTGEIKKYPIGTPISEYINWFSKNKDSLTDSKVKTENDNTLLPLIIMNGLLDGINPCAIAVLLFFINFLYMMQRTRVNIITAGIVYIFSIFMVYFLIGLGFLNAVVISGEAHFMAKLGASLVIFLGIINIMGFVWPDIPLKLEIPNITRNKIKDSLYTASLPSTLILGVLVGLCTFPCSGGIYVATLGLLSVKSTFANGIFYLIIYNSMFVLPLLIILGATSNKLITEKIFEYHSSKKRIMKLIMGILMILIGIIILIWWI